MADIPAYLLANLSVQDADTYRTYEKGLFPLLKKYGGQLVTFDDEAAHLEGVSPRKGRMIIIKFPSEQQARAWYDDADYQALSEYRRAGTTLEFLTLVRGLAPRKP